MAPTGGRKAQVVKIKEKYAVRMDPLAAPEFDEIQNIRFSPDGASLIYEGRRGAAWFVVVDGREWALETQVVHGSIRLSPDHRRLALVGVSEGRWQAMVDGKPQAPYDFIYPDTLAFSPDSRRVGYLARQRETVVVVVDGYEVKAFGNLKEARNFLAQELADGGKPTGEEG